MVLKSAAEPSGYPEGKLYASVLLGGGSWSFRQASHLASLIFSFFIFRPRGQPTLAYLQCRGIEHNSNAVELLRELIWEAELRFSAYLGFLSINIHVLMQGTF